ncbi:hypothetical protein BX265_6785 [Streptomyces sp. TLI_235]|nr:hypothetical protein [Streptomyces sp. TLI_235]PBC72164.1 hypothetical protein BX265_6785 [Streptomyces sp. TLI_235]
MRMSRVFWVVLWLDGLGALVSHRLGWSLNTQAMAAAVLNLPACVYVAARRSRG